MATTELDTLLIRLSADTANLRGEMAKANQAVAKALVGMQREAQKTNEAFSRIGAGLKGLVTGLLAGLSVANLVRATRATLEWADNIKTLADRLDITTDSVQELIFAGREVNITAEQMTKGMEHFAVAFAEAASGKGRGVIALKALGIDARDAQGNVKNLDKVWGEFAEKIKQFDRTSQLALAKTFFGEDGIKFLDLLGKGAGEMERLRQGARDAGVVIRADLIENGERLNKTLERGEDILRSGIREGLLENALLFERIVKSATDAVEQIKKMGMALNASTLSAQQFVNMFPGIAKFIREAARAAMPDAAKGLIADEPGAAPHRMSPRSAQDVAPGPGTKIADLSKGAGEANEFEKKLIKIRHELAGLNQELNFDKATAAFNKAVLDFGDTAGKVHATTEQVKLFSRTLMEIEKTKSALAIKEFTDANERLVQITAAEFVGNRELVAVLEARFQLEDRLGQKLNARQTSEIEGLAKIRFAMEENKRVVGEIKGAVEGGISNALTTLTSNFEEFFDKNKNGWDVLRDRALSVLQSIANEILRIALIQPLAKAGADAVGGWLSTFLNIGGAVASPSGGGFIGTGPGVAFASGGSFEVGGSGGTDTSPVKFMATPGEVVSVQTPAQIARGGMSGGTVNLFGSPGDTIRLDQLESGLRAVGMRVNMVDRSIEPRAIGATQDARRRGGTFPNTFR